MQLFYMENLPDEGTFSLDPEDARHALKVLRHKNGDTLWLADGKGHQLEARVVNDHLKDCQLQVVAKKHIPPPFQGTLHLAIAPTKNLDRIEWLLEKCTEIGLSKLSLMETAHTERHKTKEERLRKIAISAMKQSLQFHLPELRCHIPFEEVVATAKAAQKLIAWMGAKPNQHLAQALQPGQDTCILVGPEGGFSQEEVATAIGAGFEPVNLGPNRLRTETAGVFACSLIRGLGG